MKNLIILFAAVLFATASQAQTVTGYWYGQANVEVSGIQNNYLTELIIAQKGNRVKGFFGYYFKDVYQSFIVKGTYNPATRKVVIQDIPIIFYRTNSTENSVDCITSFYGTLHVSKVKTELTGYFYRDKKYTYTCPDLRVNYTLYEDAKVQDSIFKDMSSTRTFWKPQPSMELVKGKDAAQESAMELPSDATAKVSDKEKPGSTPAGPQPASTSAGNDKSANNPDKSSNSTARIKKVNPASTTIQEQGEAGSVMTEEKPTTPPDIVKINTEFRKRKQILGKLIDVSSDSVRLSFYDNAEVDGDSISVFLNGQLVIAHQGLTERAFNVYVRLDSTKDINEVSMFAENLGKYPPNTALMVVSDGDKRYETFLSSDFSGNATIRLRHRKNSIAGEVQ